MTTEAKQRQREKRARALVSAAITFMAITALVSIGGVAYLTLRATDQSEDNGQAIVKTTQTLAEIQAVNERLVDCTEEGGECFEATRERTSAAVTGVNSKTLAVIVAAISCQEDGITEQRALARCTVRRAR